MQNQSLETRLNSYRTAFPNTHLRLIHIASVFVLWLAIAMWLWQLPPPGMHFRRGSWAVLGMLGMYAYYHKLGHQLAWTSTIVLIILASLTYALYHHMRLTSFHHLTHLLTLVGLAAYISSAYKSQKSRLPNLFNYFLIAPIIPIHALECLLARFINIYNGKH